MTTIRIATLSEVIEQHVAPALGEFAADYDVEAIARETFEYRVDRDGDGTEHLSTVGFEQVVDEDGFWAAVERHAL